MSQWRSLLPGFDIAPPTVSHLPGVLIRDYGFQCTSNALLDGSYGRVVVDAEDGNGGVAPAINHVGLARKSAIAVDASVQPVCCQVAIGK